MEKCSDSNGLHLTALVMILISTSAILIHNCNGARINDEGHAEEYCMFETFRPQCMKNEAIVMQSAVYGRRYHGRCLEAEEPDLAQNPRYLGCAADVIGLLDAKCSGKKQCEIRIPDADLQQTKPCPKGVDLFLEVRYTCVEVVEEDRSCVVAITSSPLHIAGPSYSSTPQFNTGLHCGTRTQPWLLEAPAGQRINISLLDFTPRLSSTPQSRAATIFESAASSRALSQSHVSGTRGGGCTDPTQQYGFIIDKSSAASRKNITVCGDSTNHRLSNMYLSNSNTVELILNSGSRDNLTANFLARIEAVGCSDLVPPEDAWLKRTDNEAIIGCYTSRQTWHLKCEDRRWIGVVSNCTQYQVAAAAEKQLEVAIHVTEMNDNQVLLLVSVAFMGLAICLIIICCGVYCLRKYSLKEQKSSEGLKYSSVKDPGTYNDVRTMHSGDVINGSLLSTPNRL